MSTDALRDALARCCVQVRGAAVGSGFLVAPNLIVTCAHVLGNTAKVSSSAEVRLSNGDWIFGRVTAIAADDDDDLAIIEAQAQADEYPVLDEDDDVALDDELLVFGFPKFAMNAPQRSVLLPASYESTTGLTHRPDRLLHKFSSGRVVGGYSGSPALSLMTGKVIGIVSETIDPKAEAGGWAIRSKQLADLFPGVVTANRAIAHSDIWLAQIDEWQMRRESRSIGPPRLPLTRYVNRRVANLDETAFLNPYARVLPLIGRQSEYDAIGNWLNTPRPISIAVWTGPAGSGKTRLALEAVENAVADGWNAGFLEGERLDRFRLQNLDWVWRRKTFVVIDDAATFASSLAAWLSELNEGSVPLRIILLERHADTEAGWWRTVFQRGWESITVRRYLDPDRPVPLSPIIDPLEQRAIFVGVLEKRGSPERPPVAGSNSEFDQTLTRRAWAGDPLFLVMAALMASREKLAQILSLRHTDLADALASIERSRIEGIARGHGVKPSFLIHMAAYATLCRGLARDAVLDAVAEERAALRHGADDTDTARVAEVLAEALPGADAAVKHIEPDMLGEAFILAALGGSAGAAAVHRAGQRAPVEVASTIVRIGQDYVDTVRLAEAQSWLRALICRNDLCPQLLVQIRNEIPYPTLAFSEEAVSLAEAITRKRPAVTTPELRSEFASNLNILGVRLDALGRREAALTATEEAAAIFRELAAIRPGAFRPDLAGTLNNLGNRLEALGRREAALAATEEAAAISRELAATRPDAFRPDLAMSLNNLGNRLEALGRREAALAATEEAAAIYRELAATRPDAFRPDLAGNLNNLGNRLDALGRREAALAANEEAAAIYRELAAIRPDAFRPDLAMSLNNLGNRLDALGRREAALAAIEGAAAIYRELAATRPDAFRPDLAGTLNNLGNILEALGRHEEALAAIEEAHTIRRELAAARPDAFRPDLASSLNSLGNVLGALRRHEEALAAIEEAVAIRRELAAARPDAFRPHLATSLNNLGNRLEALGRREAALDATEEAVAIFRDLAAAGPDAFHPHLAAALSNLGIQLDALNRHDDAEAFFDEARKLRESINAPSKSESPNGD